MKKANPYAALFGLFLVGASSLLQAAPPEHPHQQRPLHQQQQAHRKPVAAAHRKDPPKVGERPQAVRPAQPAPARPGHAPVPLQARHHAPPRDFTPVHRAFHERRAQIGAGRPLPHGLRIERGRPLPHGYGKRLTAHQLRGLPHYHGYEWRRVGNDVVLVTLASGLVYAILANVL